MGLNKPKEVRARMQQKHDIEANWLKAVDFIPLAGEIIVYDEDENHTTPRMKIGDGVQQIEQLPFVGAGTGTGTGVGQSTIYGGEIFNDYKNNKALSPYTQAFGTNSTAGVMGFLVKAIDPDNLKVTVDDVNLEIKASTAYKINDILQLVGTNRNHFNLKITQLEDSTEGSVITVQQITENETLNLTISTERDNYCWVIGRNVGIPLPTSIAAYASGEEVHAMDRSAHAEGRLTKAVGAYAHAEGKSTTAGYASHAEGEITQALGEHTHAEGYNTAARGKDSHAEGTNAQANGLSAHAEGIDTKANGDYSHSEGKQTTADGIGSHAEGYNTHANKVQTHAEGSGTVADAAYAHAEGLMSKAFGQASHAEGGGTEAHGPCNHTEGQFTTTHKDATAAHAEGVKTHANGSGAHSEGVDTTADGNASHAEGKLTHAKGPQTHAEGQGTIATVYCQHAQGRYNEEDSDGNYAHIVGNGTSDTDRKNIHTVDWDGNAWYAGKITTGVNPTEAMDVTTKTYVDTKIIDATRVLGIDLFIDEDGNYFSDGTTAQEIYEAQHKGRRVYAYCEEYEEYWTLVYSTPYLAQFGFIDDGGSQYALLIGESGDFEYWEKGVALYNDNGCITSRDPIEDWEVATKSYVDRTVWENVRVVAKQKGVSTIYTTDTDYDFIKDRIEEGLFVYLVLEESDGMVRQITNAVYNKQDNYIRFDNYGISYQWNWDETDLIREV